MSIFTLLPDLPDCSVEEVSQTEAAIVITACATAPSRTSHAMRNEHVEELILIGGARVVENGTLIL
jgi:hypothetical protein